MSKKWVLNASPLIVLGKIDQLHLLKQLCEEIVVPAGVAHEIAQGSEDDPARLWLDSYGKEFIREVGLIPPRIIAWNLGQGECEVIVWADKNPDYEAVLDDRAARNCALALNIPVRGTIGILLSAKNRGLLKNITSIFFRLELAGYRIAPELLEAAKRLAEED